VHFTAYLKGSDAYRMVRPSDILEVKALYSKTTDGNCVGPTASKTLSDSVTKRVRGLPKCCIRQTCQTQ